MVIKILTFGIAKEIIGQERIALQFEGDCIADLRKALCEKYPRLAKIKSFALAVNLQYAQETDVLKDEDEVAIIPPVSGG